MTVVGTKVTPPEREVMRQLSGSHWAMASTLSPLVGMPVSKVGAKLRRLEALGHVQSMPMGTGKGWRLTTGGVEFKHAHLAGWRPLVGWEGDPRTTSVRERDTRKVGRTLYPYARAGSCWGVEYADGSFAWVESECLEVLV